MAPATTTTAEEILLLLRESKRELLGEAASLVTPTTNQVVDHVLTAAVDAVANEDGLVAKTMRKVDFLCKADVDEVVLALVREYLKGKLSRVRELKERLEAVAEEVEDDDDDEE